MDNKFLIIDLTPYFNADGISSDDNREDGVLGLVTSFPAEELPGSGEIVYINKVPFIIPPKEDGKKNNIECYKEVIEIEKGNYSMLHILGCCDNGSFRETFKICYKETNRIYKIGITDTILKNPIFSEKKAFRFSHMHTVSGDQETESFIWHQNQILESNLCLQKIILPDNPCYHIFAMTLERVG